MNMSDKYMRTWNKNPKRQKNHEDINWCVQSQIDKWFISYVFKINIQF